MVTKDNYDQAHNLQTVSVYKLDQTWEIIKLLNKQPTKIFIQIGLIDKYKLVSVTATKQQDCGRKKNIFQTPLFLPIFKINNISHLKYKRREISITLC